MLKKSVPIVSSNVKYLGLSIPEWVLMLAPCGLYFILFNYINKDFINYAICGHVVLIFVYVFFISKLEENILQIILINLNIPSIVYGFFRRPLPINKFISLNSEFINNVESRF